MWDQKVANKSHIFVVEPIKSLTQDVEYKTTTTNMTPWRSFLKETSLHGLKYLNVGIKFEKLFWFITTASSWAFGIFMIHLVWTKWTESPVLVSFDDQLTPIWKIPFPAVTICNMNKILKSKVEKLTKNLKFQPQNKTLILEKILVEEICNVHGEKSKEHGHDLLLDGDQFLYYLQDMSPSCEHMMLKCHFGGYDKDCDYIFESILTDDGKCCSFNIMPKEIMTKSNNKKIETDELRIKTVKEKEWEDWTPQEGYIMDSQIDWQKPSRATSPGLSMGFSILMDVNEDEYYCSNSQSVGFKALLHSPANYPELLEFGFALSPGTENFIAVNPQYMFAKEEIHSIHYTERQCFFEDEKSLRYFEHYSYINCFLECISNHTFSVCECVAYYMPHPEDVPICSPIKMQCMKEAKLQVEKSMNAGNSISEKCECLPACTELHYPFEASSSVIKKASMLHLDGKDLKYKNDTYVQNNLVYAHIYFQHLHFIRHERGQLYGPIDVIANVGGLLGLCSGLSLLSLVECLYFFGIKYLLQFLFKKIKTRL